jgi:branched-chain amino acid transport system substrate-binding protein
MVKVRFHRSWRLLAAMLAVFALIAAACGDDDAADTPTDTEESSSDDAATTDEETPAEEPAAEEPEADDGGEPATDEEPAEEEPPAEGDATVRDIGALGPPTGEPIVIGFVNTEGPAGLNFPELEDAAVASVDYLNEHGGMGNRPIQLEVCIAEGSPESSQACAQELAGKDVEMVLIGLDLFPDYATYDAAGIPVAGIIPLFPADYASDAIYFGGGNATLAAANAYVAKEFFGATKVAIISADNAGANSSEASVIAALEKAGIEYRSIKGAESETDAGAQGLVREALSDDPDLLISLYGDAGCIGMIRGRAALGSDVPVLAANTCTNGEVLEAVGDDAFGWIFLPGGEPEGTAEALALKTAIAPVAGVENPEDVVPSDLGLGSLSPIVVFTVAAAANDLAATGGEVTGAAVAEHIKTNPDGRLSIFPDGATLTCGQAEAYPSVCDLSLFAGEYVGDGRIELVEGLESFDVTEYLP